MGQVRNLRSAEEHAETLRRLSSRLDAYLRETGDPRMEAGSCKFDPYPYRALYLEKGLEKWRKGGGSRVAGAPSDAKSQLMKRGPV